MDLPEGMTVPEAEVLGTGDSNADFEQQQIRLTEEAMDTAGFVGGSLLHSYSHPAKYVVTSSFESIEAAWAFGKSDVFTNAMKRGPAGAVTVTQQEGYELAHEVFADPLPDVGCEILIDEVIKGPEVIPAFEATLGQLFEVRRQHSAGYGYNRLFRSRIVDDEFEQGLGFLRFAVAQVGMGQPHQRPFELRVYLQGCQVAPLGIVPTMVGRKVVGLQEGKDVKVRLLSGE